MLRSLSRLLTTIVLGLLGALGIVILVAGVIHLFSGHDDPSIAGRGRLHGPGIETVRCHRRQGICARDPYVRLDLPNGQSERVYQQRLYDLVSREGPVSVEVEWVKDVGQSTRVRYKGHWYRANYAVKASDDVSTIVAMVLLGLPLTFFAGGGFIARLPFGGAPEPQPG